MTAFFTVAKMYSLCSMDPLNEQNLIVVHKLMTSVQCHNMALAIVTFKNGKHSTVLCTGLLSLCKCVVTN